jgi:signal transduction histidine kinase
VKLWQRTQCFTERNAPASEEQARLLKQVQKGETALLSKVNKLATDQQDDFKWLVRGIKSSENQVRTYTVVFGLIAVTLGLLMTVWAVFTLRPLRRLRDAAQRIAHGDYGSRIDERGPTEVADLAHEFNVMGRAVEERERELVRSERLVAVGKMAAMITHEVRNLAVVAIGHHRLLQEEAPPPERAAEARALCTAINAEVDRDRGITEGYLQFTPARVEGVAEPIRHIIATRLISPAAT